MENINLKQKLWVYQKPYNGTDDNLHLLAQSIDEPKNQSSLAFLGDDHAIGTGPKNHELLKSTKKHLNNL